MTTPEDPEREPSSDSVDLTKGEPADEAPFDPYRFGKPDYPIPAEYAPPGYTGPVTQTPPPAPGWGPPSTPDAGNPFSNPPGTPYTPYGGDPNGYSPGPYPPSAPPPGQYPQPSGQYPAPSGQYPPPLYGPPPGYYPPPQGFGPQPATGNGKAVAALVLGIGSIVFCFFSFFDALLVIPGLILGFIALSESRAPGRTGRGMAMAGLVCSVVGALLATVFTVLLVHAANQCGGLDNSKAPGWNNCVRHNFF